MKNKQAKILAIIVIVILIIASVISHNKRADEPATEAVRITVEVVHADESTNEYTYITEADMLGTVLLDEGLVEGYEGEYGLVIESVEGEQAIYEEDGAYWSLLIDGEYAQTGADSTPVEEGTVYSLVYTLAE